MLSGPIVAAQAVWPRRRTQLQHEKRVGFVPRFAIVPPPRTTVREDLMRTGLKAIAAGLVIGAAAFYANAVSAEDGWITLLDSSNKGDWTEVGKANWAMKDGALSADKLDGKDPSYMV